MASFLPSVVSDVKLGQTARAIKGSALNEITKAAAVGIAPGTKANIETTSTPVKVAKKTPKKKKKKSVDSATVTLSDNHVETTVTASNKVSKPDVTEQAATETTAAAAEQLLTSYNSCSNKEKDGSDNFDTAVALMQESLGTDSHSWHVKAEQPCAGHFSGKAKGKQVKTPKIQPHPSKSFSNTSQLWDLAGFGGSKHNMLNDKKSIIMNTSPVVRKQFAERLKNVLGNCGLLLFDTAAKKWISYIDTYKFLISDDIYPFVVVNREQGMKKLSLLELVYRLFISKEPLSVEAVQYFYTKLDIPAEMWSANEKAVRVLKEGASNFTLF